MATFRRERNGYIYLYHWLNSITPLKVSTRIKINEKEWNKKKAKPRDIEANVLTPQIVGQKIENG